MRRIRYLHAVGIWALALIVFESWPAAALERVRQAGASGQATQRKIERLSKSKSRTNTGVWIMRPFGLLRLPDGRLSVVDSRAIRITRSGGQLSVQFGRAKSQPGGTKLMFILGRDECSAECTARFCKRLSPQRHGRSCGSMVFGADHVGTLAERGVPGGGPSPSVDDVVEVLEVELPRDQPRNYLRASAIEEALIGE